MERYQGVIQQWVEPPTCPDRTELAVRLQWASRIQLEDYPAIRGRSRSEAFPGLTQPARPYGAEHEVTLWQLSRVDQFLARGFWRRHVDATGKISLYNHNYRIGRRYAEQEVGVRFDAVDRHWVIEDARGQVVQRHPAEQLSVERIIGLDVMHRRRTNQEQTGAKPDVAGGQA